MISKCLNDIKVLLEKIDKIFNDTDYFKNLEERLAKIQKENQQLREELDKLRKDC